MDELEGFHTLGDVILWSKLNGDPRYSYPQAGPPLALLGCDGDTDAAEFASTTPLDVEDAVAKL